MLLIHARQEGKVEKEGSMSSWVAVRGYEKGDVCIVHCRNVKRSFLEMVSWTPANVCPRSVDGGERAQRTVVALQRGVEVVTNFQASAS